MTDVLRPRYQLRTTLRLNGAAAALLPSAPEPLRTRLVRVLSAPSNDAVVDNETVNAAIAEDAAASRTALELGSAALASAGAFEATGAAEDAIAEHVAALDPHPDYTTSAELATAISNALNALVGAAPLTLDTLAEIAAALGNDPNLATTLTAAIAAKLPSSAVSAFLLTVLDDADGAAARATLGAAAPPDAQSFAASGTWTKPAGNFKFVRVRLWGGGGGGGAGSKHSAGTASFGGGGAQAGSYVERVFDFASLPATVSVTIGAGGPGAPAQVNNSANGNNGTTGSASTFGNYLYAPGGAPGNGGSTTNGSGGSATTGGTLVGRNGANSSATAQPGASAATFANSSGGGAGGGVSTGDTAFAGGPSTVTAANGTTRSIGQVVADTTGGAVNTNGATGAYDDAMFFSAGGSGGGASTSGNGGTGGTGGKYGAGGGGGGAARNSVGNGGAGGPGADGFCIVECV